MKIRKKLHQYDCLVEYFYMNEITKKIQLSDYVQESQVLRGFQKSKLMLLQLGAKKTKQYKQPYKVSTTGGRDYVDSMCNSEKLSMQGLGRSVSWPWCA